MISYSVLVGFLAPVVTVDVARLIRQFFNFLDVRLNFEVQIRKLSAFLVKHACR